MSPLFTVSKREGIGRPTKLTGGDPMIQAPLLHDFISLGVHLGALTRFNHFAVDIRFVLKRANGDGLGCLRLNHTGVIQLFQGRLWRQYSPIYSL